MKKEKSKSGLKTIAGWLGGGAGKVVKEKKKRKKRLKKKNGY
jgi:hypothetical protein